MLYTHIYIYSALYIRFFPSPRKTSAASNVNFTSKTEASAAHPSPTTRRKTTSPSRVGLDLVHALLQDALGLQKGSEAYCLELPKHPPKASKRVKTRPFRPKSRQNAGQIDAEEVKTPLNASLNEGFAGEIQLVLVGASAAGGTEPRLHV